MADAKLIAFVKQEEGFTSKAIWDFHQYTNGYGTKALDASEHIDPTVAQDRLVAELDRAVAAVEKIAPQAPQGVKDALADLTFNSGTAWEHADLGKYVKAGDWANAKAHFLMYDQAGHKTLPDLAKRRAKAAEWFPTAAREAVQTPVPAPAPQVAPADPVAPAAPGQAWDPTMGSPEPQAAPTPAESMWQRLRHAVEETL